MEHVKFLITNLLFMCAAMQAATITVQPGTKTIRDAVAAASAGDVLELTTGTYTESSNITWDKALTLQAAQGANPEVNFSVYIKAYDEVTIKNLTITCTHEDYLLRLYPNEGGVKYSATIDNCYFIAKDAYFVVAKENGEQADSYLNSVTITNSTFNRTATSTSENRSIDIRHADNEHIGVAVTIDHCTFYGGASERGIYLPYVDGSTISNCIYMLPTKVDGAKSYCMYGENCTLSNSISFNAELYQHDAKTVATGVRNPYFVDAENNNFQLFKNSPAVGKATDGSNIGDPRWGVSDKEYDDSDVPLDELVVKFPYSMRPTTTSLRILWEMNNDKEEGTVYYGTDSTNLDQSATASTGMTIDGEGRVHYVDLTGLQPSTTYYYQAGQGTRRISGVNSAKTAPEKGTAFRIFTISDIHVNACKNWSNMQDFICTLDADLMMCNGDFVNNGNGRDWNEALFTPGRPFLSQTVMMSAPGNHETGDPDKYRYSTFFDYFWQFSHDYIDGNDEIKDPRGESYFAYDYGNAKIIAVNVNGDKSSPSHLKNSKQIEWVENQIKNASQDWILIFGHVGLTTSAYHGQWPPEGRDAWRAMFEKYHAEGKKIIYFCGDDHSFEHAYKDGVHYVRPGCGRNSNYTQVTSLADAQYSMFFKSVSCYSTLDMSADGSQLHMVSRDSASNIFYEYTFLKDGEEIGPDIHFLAPTADVEVADSVRIQWFAFNPTKDATISLYYTEKDTPEEGTLIKDGIEALPKSQRYLYWQTRKLDKKTYHIYATIANGKASKSVMLPYTVTLVPDTIAPAAPRLTGDIRDNQYFLAWENPNKPITTIVPLTNLKETIVPFETNNEDGAVSTISREDGLLKVDVDFTIEWASTSVDLAFKEPTDLSQTPTLHFAIKGAGVTTAMRIEVKNMANGNEDLWYLEDTKFLKTKGLTDFAVDLRSLMAYDWHTNADDKNRLDQVVSISFTISLSSAWKNTYYLGDCYMSGQTSAAPDFAGTVIVRNDEHFPADRFDGVKVYEGKDEDRCYDTTADPAKIYYYGAFAYDDVGNISLPTDDSQWLSSDLDPYANLPYTLHTPQSTIHKLFCEGQVLIERNGAHYTVLGIKH